MDTSNSLDDWFTNLQHVLETAYIAHEEPWAQSGMSGPAERWDALRRPVADCIDRSGSLLDIGCANGYLLECCLGWTAERGIALEPYGIDLSPALVILARQRLPHYADNLFVANAWSWSPPRRFTFVRTELVYLPAEHERAFVDRLCATLLEPGGRLLIANYAEGNPNVARNLLPGSHPTVHLLDRLAELDIPVIDYKDGLDPRKRSNTRVAIVSPPF